MAVSYKKLLHLMTEKIVAKKLETLCRNIRLSARRL